MSTLCNLRASAAVAEATWALLIVPGAIGCDKPETDVVFDNRYPASSAIPLVVYRAQWQAVWVDASIPPGSSSAGQISVPASTNTAYVVLAPGWDPASSSVPASFVVMQSTGGFDLHLDTTLHIPIDDTTFTGNCASGSFLSQAQADFITQFIFPGDFASLRYDAATCTTTRIGDAGSP